MTISSRGPKVERVVPNALSKMFARVRATCSTSSWDKPIHLALMAVVVLSLIGCELTNDVPPVTPRMASSKSIGPQDLQLMKLQQGRILFAHRCIECHTLPPLWHYSTEDWPEIVSSMSHRASLKPPEREAILSYILAARKQM